MCRGRRPDRRGRRGRLGRRARRRARVSIGRIGFAYNPTIEQATELSERAAGWCRMHGVEQWAIAADDTAAMCAKLPETDVLVVLGGDGTFLRAVQAVIAVDVPILGINLGRIGFLSKAETDELESVLELLAGGLVRAAAEDGPRGRDPARRAAGVADLHRAQRHRHRARLAGPRRPDVRLDRRVAPRDVHRRRPGRRPARPARPATRSRPGPDPRPAQPQPRRDADRRLPLGHPLDRRRRPTRSSAARSSTPTRRSSRSTAARTTGSRSATWSRCAPSSGRSGSSSRPAACRSGTCSGRRSSCCRRDRRTGARAACSSSRSTTSR